MNPSNVSWQHTAVVMQPDYRSCAASSLNAGTAIYVMSHYEYHVMDWPAAASATHHFAIPELAPEFRQLETVHRLFILTVFLRSAPSSHDVSTTLHTRILAGLVFLENLDIPRQYRRRRHLLLR